jgi:TetR/AcrR family transcriptional regulator
MSNEEIERSPASDASTRMAAPEAPAEVIAQRTQTPPSQASAQAPTTRKRPRPGERRVQILQTLAAMLERPGAERVTTAALAAQLEVSEAALYRHFASKAQMFEGLIDFIEQSVFTLFNQVLEREALSPRERASRIVMLVVQFAEKNPGMTRVMVGDALVNENERLQQRMNHFFERIESTLRQALRGSADPETPPSALDVQVRAAVLTAFVVGRLQRYARSGFRRPPSEHLEESLALML